MMLTRVPAVNGIPYSQRPAILPGSTRLARLRAIAMIAAKHSRAASVA